MGRKKKEIDPNQPKKIKASRHHSIETRMKISEKRRARTQQPRHVGQSKKSLSFWSELKNEYSKISDKKLTDRQKKKLSDAKKWIEENKYELGHVDNVNDFRMLLPDYEKWGILTEYREMYHQAYEERIGDMLYSDERTPLNERDSNDPYMMIEQLDNDYNEAFGIGDFDE